jgi:hypothetical protein
MTLCHVGDVASSKSASQTLAPEFSALTVILRSVGPVISTRRSSRPGAVGATCHDSSSRIERVSGRKPSGFSPDCSSSRRTRRASSSSRRRPANVLSSLARKSSAAGVRISANRPSTGPVTSMR